MPQKLLLVILAFFALTLNTCKKEEAQVWKTYGPYYLGEARDYIYFEQGSWWVYKDVETGKLDTMYLIDSKIDTITYEDNYRGKSENRVVKEDYSFTLFSRTTQHEYYHHLSTPFVWEGMTDENQDRFNFKVSKTKPGSFYFINSIFYFPFIPRSTSNYSYLIAKDSTVYIDSVRYEHVAVFHVEDDDFFESQDSYVFWAPTYGRIKHLSLKSGNELILVESHIIQ